ncbi:MAG: N-formylglutamate amidohydrolase [Steroidobacteraceae bacterium]
MMATLLSPDEPPACSIEHEQGASSFLLVCDHASHRIPRMLGGLGLPAAELMTHIAWDIGAAAVAQRLAQRLQATLVLQNYSRLVIDCNRPLDAPDSVAITSGGVEVPGNRALSSEQRLMRQNEVFLPYHGAIRDILDRRAQGPPAVLVSVHSFTPIFLGDSRPWHCGVLYNRDARLALALRDLLRSDFLRVGENEPYAMRDSSDYTVPVHGEARGLAHVELEIRQDLISDDRGQEEWATRLALMLPQALEVVAL